MDVHWRSGPPFAFTKSFEWTMVAWLFLRFSPLNFITSHFPNCPKHFCWPEPAWLKLWSTQTQPMTPTHLGRIWFLLSTFPSNYGFTRKPFVLLKIAQRGSEPRGTLFRWTRWRRQGTTERGECARYTQSHFSVGVHSVAPEWQNLLLSYKYSNIVFEGMTFISLI